MKRLRYGIWASTLAGGLLMPLLCWATPAVLQTFPEPNAVPPVQGLAVVHTPWYSLPGRFFFSGGYYMHLNLTEMRIDHVSEDSRCTKKNRIFMISVSFGQPIGNRLFSSSFELPLLSADRLAVNRLVPASVGDYVLHMSNAPMFGSSSQLLISARF